jgi:hypothetical protein
MAMHLCNKPVAAHDDVLYEQQPGIHSSLVGEGAAWSRLHCLRPK